MKLFVTYLLLMASLIFAVVALYSSTNTLVYVLCSMLAGIVGVYAATRRNRSGLVRRYRVNGVWHEEPLERPRRK